MHTIQDLFDEIEEHHSHELCVDPSEVDSLESKYGHRLPTDLKSFYHRYRTVSLFESPAGPSYRFVAPPEIHPTRLDIHGQDTDDWGPGTWLTICDVLDGNYVSIDIASESGNQYNYIDCFHETFAVPGESAIIARSFTELLQSALQSEDNEIFWLLEGFVAYGDGMPLIVQNAAMRIEGSGVKDSGWLIRFSSKGKDHRDFFSDRQHGSKYKSFEAVEHYIEEATK